VQPPQTIETQRLILRPLVVADAEAIFAGYAQDPEVTRYLIWRPHETVETTTRFVERCIACWREGTTFPWAIIHKADRRLIGMIEMRVEPPAADFGYALARAYWGQGLMPEAAQAVVEWALAQPEINRVWAVCDVENRASVRVMEKVGMQREALLPGFLEHPNAGDAPRDCWRYARVRRGGDADVQGSGEA